MDREEIIRCLESDDTTELFRRADEVRRECCGDEIHLRGIVEFSNHCKRGCLYCGLRCANESLTRYRLSPEEILEASRDAFRLGYRTLVLQAGEDEGFSTETLCDVVRKIKSELDVAVTLSVGEKSEREYEAMRRAGADRYLLKFETSNPELFRRLKPDSSMEERWHCLDVLRELGFQVGSGMMVGLPGQTPAMIADDILRMASFDFDMLGIGPFIPHPDTPLAASAPGAVELVLKTVALTRIVTRRAHMPATTAIGSIDPEGRQKALGCGANVLMPNVTPPQYRKLYSIYPGKICIDEKPSDCRGCTAAMAIALGRRIGQGKGDTIRTSLVQ
jgi:biotin synthase